MEEYMEIPSGNSMFQIQNFVIKGTPERKLRICLLQLRQKETAMMECQFKRRKFDIDKREKNEKLQTATGYEKERLIVELEEIDFQMNSQIDLINDCAVEIAVYRKTIEDLPKFTRSEFEDAEYEYWKARLLKDARQEITSIGTISKSTIESLEDIGIIIGRNKDNRIVYEKKLLE